MSNKNDQNSLQPSLSGQLDASPGNSVNNENCKQICRDFIWGLCNKGTQCKYRHELDFEAMKKTLKFCHDYQNPSGCTREHCTYLHTSKEEESLFFATATLPRVLAERHANITVSSAETIPQIALFIQESLVGPPPPPPPSTAPSSPLIPRAATMPLQQLPPPPPPITTTANTVQPSPLFTVPPPQPTPAFTINQPPPPLPLFDASRPPPPIPAMVQQKNTTRKRPPPNDTCAAPCKLRKTEEPKPDDALCDLCVQREIRIEKYRQEMEKISAEDEYQTLLYKKKLMEYQKQRDILRKLINSDYKFVQEFLEDVPQYSFREPLSNLNPSFLAGMSQTGPKHNHQQFLLQFMEYMFSNTRSFESSSVRVEESLRTLSTTPRRTSHQSPDILQTLKDILGHATSSERSVSSELSVERAQSPGTNGVSSFRRYTNGQRVETRVPPPPAPLPPPAPAPPPPAPAAPPAPPPPANYPHYPPPYMPVPRAPPAPRPPCPPYTLERYPAPSAPSPYYHYQ